MGIRGESRATKERREMGRMSLAEASRVLGRHRDSVLRLVTDGRLERGEDGTFDAEEVAALVEELEAQRSDPAVEHLKMGFKWALKSQDQNLEIYLKAHSQILQTQARVIDQQAEHIQKLIGEIQKLSEKVRRYEDGTAERQLIEKQVEKESANQHEFLSLAGDVVTGFMREKSIAGKLKTIFESLDEAQAEKLGEVLRPEQLVQLQGAISSVEKLTGSKNEN